MKYELRLYIDAKDGIWTFTRVVDLPFEPSPRMELFISGSGWDVPLITMDGRWLEYDIDKPKKPPTLYLKPDSEWDHAPLSVEDRKSLTKMGWKLYFFDKV